jgi:hypothetical protein
MNTHQTQTGRLKIVKMADLAISLYNSRESKYKKYLRHTLNRVSYSAVESWAYERCGKIRACIQMQTTIISVKNYTPISFCSKNTV